MRIGTTSSSSRTHAGAEDGLRATRRGPATSERLPAPLAVAHGTPAEVPYARCFSNACSANTRS